MSDIDPLGIFLVTSGSRGVRLCFRFPYDTPESKETAHEEGPMKNPYAIEEDYEAKRDVHRPNISHDTLLECPDTELAHLLAVKGDLCGRRFEVKVDDVVFAGFPLLLDNQAQNKRETQTMISFNIVFALPSTAYDSLIIDYQDLAKQLAVSLRHEETRCGYLDTQKSIMTQVQEDMNALSEANQESPHKVMLKKCALARQLKSVYDNLVGSGIVQLYINRWIYINFCLPHKVYNLHLPRDVNIRVKPELVKQCLSSLRPYHAMLLLVNEDILINSLPIDSSPALTRLIKMASPKRSLQDVSSYADLPLGQIYHLVCHLVSWGKATIIYPLCETNIYVLAPNTNTYVNSSLVEKFVSEFPGTSLHMVLADFSLPSRLKEHRDVLGLPRQHTRDIQVVIWLLKHCLLIQLHTYVFLVPRPTLPGASSNNKSISLSMSGPSPCSFEDVPVFKTHSFPDNVSDGSPSISTFSTQTPSVEVRSDGFVVTEEMRAQWALHENILAHLTPEQRTAVSKVPAASNTEDLKLFARLSDLFNGKHHLEEIMYYENVTRSNLMTLLEKFRRVLITCEHEDPGTSRWITG